MIDLAQHALCGSPILIAAVGRAPMLEQRRLIRWATRAVSHLAES